MRKDHQTIPYLCHFCLAFSILHPEGFLGLPAAKHKTHAMGRVAAYAVQSPQLDPSKTPHKVYVWTEVEMLVRLLLQVIFATQQHRTHQSQDRFKLPSCCYLDDYSVAKITSRDCNLLAPFCGPSNQPDSRQHEVPC